MTDAVVFKNNATARLGINVAAASITVTLETGTGARFPTPGVDEFFPLIVKDERTGQFEIMYCTQRIADILTVDRAKEGTTAQDWLLGASAWSTATAGVFETYFDYSWSKDEADARYVNTTGDTMTGLLLLPSDPVLPKHATTKEWVEELVGGSTGATLLEAPNDGLPYVRQSIGWVQGVRKSTYDAAQAATAASFSADQAELDDHTSDIAANVAAIALRLTDAPSDGSEYIRKNGAWAILGAALTDAPSDGVLYGRRNSVWTAGVRLAGDTMTGALTLSGAPSSALHAVTKTYADAITTAYIAADALKANLASPTLTGVPAAPTAGAGTSTTQLATTAFVAALGALKANLAGPTFTGVPAAPTPAPGTNTTQLATTAFALAEIAAKAVRYDAAQALTVAQQLQAHSNFGDLNSVVFRSSAYNVVLGDRHKLFYISGSCTLTLPAVATVGNDFSFAFKTDGGILTLTATGAAVITDGPTSGDPQVIPEDYAGFVWCDAANWHMIKWPLPTAEARNRIVNPAMQVSQEWGILLGGPVSAASYYPADQWHVASVLSPGAITIQRVAVDTPNGSTYRLRIIATTAKAALAAGDYCIIRQPIEGYNIADFSYGSAAAKSSVLRFGFKGPAGTYTVVVRNGVFSRSYIKSFVISAGQANTDTEQVLVIPGDITGTWDTTSGSGIDISIVLAAGTSWQGVVNTWQAVNDISIAGAFNGVGTVNNTFELFDVGLYLDRDNTQIPPKWKLPDYETDLSTCQRYFQDVYGIGSFTPTSGQSYYLNTTLPVLPRPGATVSGQSLTASNFVAATGTLTLIPNSIRELRAASATGASGAYASQYTVDGRM